MVFAFVSCDDSAKVPEEPDTPTVPEYEYANTIQVSNVDELIGALDSLEENTEIILKEGIYDFQGKSTDVEFNGQEGWLIPIIKNNVALKAEKGADVKILSTDNIPNGAHASQTIIIVTGENFILDGVTIGVRGSKNKSVEIASKNAVINNVNFIDGACLYISSKNALNTTVMNSVFDNESSISFSNGASILNLYNNVFKSNSIVYLTGYRNSGWNPDSIDISSADIQGNTFEKDSIIELKADPADFEKCFADFDPVKLFGMELKETLKDTYGATKEVYVK